MSGLNNNKEIIKESLIKIVKIIEETTNKTGGYGDTEIGRVMTSVMDGFNNRMGRVVYGMALSEVIHTNKIGEVFSKGDVGFRKCKRTTQYHKLGEIVKHRASKGQCADDAFFSEIYKTKGLCNYNEQ